MGQFNDAARTAHVAAITAAYTTATLREPGGQEVETYDLTGRWTAGAAGVRATASVEGIAGLDASFPTDPQAQKGALVLTGAGPEVLTLTAGGPGSGADVIVRNDKAIPDGQVFAGKAVTLTGITLTFPA